MEGEWLTTGQVARLSGLNPSTVWRAIKGGHLEARRVGVGRRHFIRLDHAHAYAGIATGDTDSTTTPANPSGDG